MDDNKKKKRIGYGAIIGIFLLIVILGLGGWFAYEMYTHSGNIDRSVKRMVNITVNEVPKFGIV